MALFDHTTDEVTAKIVFFGPNEAGKKTNLRHIKDKLSASSGAELATVTTETGSTLVLDYLPAEPLRVRGLRLRFQLCALAGQAPSLAARRAVLKGADAVVFVADSEADALVANEQSLDTMSRALSPKGGELPIPMVIQYNKRDLPTALPVEKLKPKLNPRGLPAFEAIAAQGIGVDETLRVIVRLCFKSLTALHGEAGAAASLLPKPAEAGARRDTVPALPPEPPGAPPPRQRVPTHQSLAGKSLAMTPPAADPGETTTVRFTRHEILEKLRANAEAAAKKTEGPKKG